MAATSEVDVTAPGPGTAPRDRAVRIAVGAARCLLALLLFLITLVLESPASGVVGILLLEILGHVLRAPKVASFDISTWTSPQRLALHAHSGWFILAAVVVAVVIDFSLFTTGVEDWADERFVRHVAVALAGLIPVALVVGAYEFFRSRRGGWVTIDPVARTLTWRRPPKDRGEERTWSFDDITATKVRRTATADVVRVDLGEQRLQIHAPLGTAPALAESLAAARSWSGPATQRSVV